MLKNEQVVAGDIIYAYSNYPLSRYIVLKNSTSNTKYHRADRYTKIPKIELSRLAEDTGENDRSD